MYGDTTQTTSSDACPEAVVDGFRALRGAATPALKDACQESPEFFAALLTMAQVPSRRSELSEMEQALVALSVVGNIAFAHDGRQAAMVKRARAAGATEGQIQDTLRIASVLGVHSLTVGVDAMVEALQDLGVDLSAYTDLDERQFALKQQFVDARGYWHESWDNVLAFDPEMFAAYTAFSRFPADRNALEPRLRELLYIAIDAVATHLYVPGIKLHVVNAVNLGVTPREIICALEIASLTGIEPYLDSLEITG